MKMSPEFAVLPGGLSRMSSHATYTPPVPSEIRLGLALVWIDVNVQACSFGVDLEQRHDESNQL